MWENLSKSPKNESLGGPAEWWWGLENSKSDVYSQVKTTESADRGTAAMYNFASLDDLPAKFETPRELFFALRAMVDERYSNINSNRRYLIVLEDLGRNWVELLGPYLKIPPYFFELHWANPLLHTMGMNRMPLGQDSQQIFVLGYTELHPGVTIPRDQGWAKINLFRTLV
jgi:hypothetical protein